MWGSDAKRPHTSRVRSCLIVSTYLSRRLASDTAVDSTSLYVGNVPLMNGPERSSCDCSGCSSHPRRSNLAVSGTRTGLHSAA